MRAPKVGSLVGERAVSEIGAGSGGSGSGAGGGCGEAVGAGLLSTRVIPGSPGISDRTSLQAGGLGTVILREASLLMARSVDAVDEVAVERCHDG